MGIFLSLPQGWLLPCHEPSHPPELPLPADLKAMLLSAANLLQTLPPLSGSAAGHSLAAGLAEFRGSCHQAPQPARGPAGLAEPSAQVQGEGTHTQHVATCCWLCTHLLGSHFAHLLNGDDSTYHISLL